MRRKKSTNRDAEEKRWVFSFDLKEESVCVNIASKGQTQGVLQTVIMGTSQQKFLLQFADFVRSEQVSQLDVQV